MKRSFNSLSPLDAQAAHIRLGVALLPTFIILFVHRWLPAVATNTPAIVFYPLVFLSGWLGGFWAGTIMTLSCSTYAILVLRPHILTDPMSDIPSLIRLFIFLSTSLLFLILTAALERALKKARLAVATRDEFISLASHELKTPLTAITLQLEILKRCLTQETPKKLNDRLTNTKRQVDRLSKIIISMMDLSLLDSGQLLLQKSSCNLNKLLRDSISSLEFEAQNAGSQIKFQPTETIEGEWDRVRLEQVVFNLIQNAIKYGNSKNVELATGKDQDYVWFRISDEGLGVSAEDCARIFKRFERAHASIQGLGLGLYLSQKIVHLHGGEITLQSEIGKGSHFTVKLPAKDRNPVEIRF